MFSPDNLSALIKELTSRFNGQNTNGGTGTGTGTGTATGGGGGKKGVSVTPSQALVISGILGGVLDVISVLVDKDQTVQIILEGSLKQKTQLEKMMDQIGSMPFDQVMKALLDRLL